jgi:uncharacterized cupin superfamily protein
MTDDRPSEAPLEDTPAGRAPTAPGWFVLNAEQAPWMHTDRFGSACAFEARRVAGFEQMGFNVRVLAPGQPGGMYHGEPHEEAALVVSGEALLIVEGEERPLRRWDFVHLPPGTRHVIVGAGDGPCVLVMAGTRGPGEIEYPAEPAARRHGAALEHDTTDPREAYAGVQPSFGPGSIPG